MEKCMQRSAWAVAVGLCFAVGSAQAITLETESGWKAQFMGLVSAWTGYADFDETFPEGPSGDVEEETYRVLTGFNPSKFEFLVSAPEYNGINVSAYFQVASSINGGKNRRTGEQIEVRGADIAIGTPYGTINFGRSFAIFSSSAILNDTSSMRGVGYLCVGPDGSGPNCGHIGTGYTWTDWTAGLRYTSPRLAGLQLRAGAFDPVEQAFGTPGGGTPFITDSFGGTFFNFTDIGGTSDIETNSPLFEVEVNYLTPLPLGGLKGNVNAWAGFMRQSIDDLGSSNDTTIEGYNFGGRLTVGDFGLTGNWEATEGIAEGFIGFGTRCDAIDCDTVEGNGWYVNGDYTFLGKTVVGVSYGEGSEDANSFIGNGDVERELLMVYVQHQLTPNLNVNIEFQDFERSSSNGVAAGIFAPEEEYQAVLVGGEFRF